jgi:hypothetical protein
MTVTGQMVVTLMSRNSTVLITIPAIATHRRPVGADRWQFRSMLCELIAAIYNLSVQHGEYAFNGTNGILFNSEVIFAEHRKVG